MALSPPPHVLFRADGNSRIGLGHLTRCQALAELLTRAGWRCALATREPPGRTWFSIYLDANNFTSLRIAAVLPIPADLPLADEPAWLLQQGSQVLVLDGYGFDVAYQQRCWQSGRGLVVFDDFARSGTCADVVINAAGGLDAAHYAGLVGPGTRLCLGPGYALLRENFWQVQQRAQRPPNTDRLFLCLGGADPGHHTLPLMQELAARFPAKHLSVVTGAAYPHRAALAAAAAALPNVRLHHNLGASQLAELLRRCGVLVCPPSGLAYECGAVGGLLLLVQTADNQQLMYDYLTNAGLALPYAALAALPPAEWPAQAAALRQRQRVVFSEPVAWLRFFGLFRELLEIYALGLRRATAANALTYFGWANDPAVRATAVQPARIDWPTHRAWFERRLADPDSYLYLFSWQNQLTGQVRIQFEGNIGTISYSLDKAWRGKRLGRPVLRRALAELRRQRPGAWTLRGLIRTDNLASQRVFEGLGFVLLGHETHGAATFNRFELAAPALPAFT